MTETATRDPWASPTEVVEAYLEQKYEANRPERQREQITQATLEIVDAFEFAKAGEFTVKDVQACVQNYLEQITEASEFEDVPASKRNRIVRKALDDLTAMSVIYATENGYRYGAR